MNISIIVPCLNEEQNIESLHLRLKSILDNLRHNYEIIFIDDGSTDRTVEVLRRVITQDEKTKAFRLHRHYGKDIAFSVGFKCADGDTIITIDSDLQNYPEDIPLLLDKLKEYDAVIGWRKDRYDSLLKKISSCIANFIRKIVLCDNLHDAGCGLRAFRKACLTELGVYNLYDLFLMPILKMKGYRVGEVALRHAPRRFGKSKFNIRNRVFRNGIELFVIWWMRQNILANIKFNQIKTDK